MVYTVCHRLLATGSASTLFLHTLCWATPSFYTRAQFHSLYMDWRNKSHMICKQWLSILSEIFLMSTLSCPVQLLSLGCDVTTHALKIITFFAALDRTEPPGWAESLWWLSQWHHSSDGKRNRHVLHSQQRWKEEDKRGRSEIFNGCPSPQRITDFNRKHLEPVFLKMNTGCFTEWEK